MNDVLREDLFDIVGFGTGIVKDRYLLPNEVDMERGDVIIGLESSGPHSNGYTLIRELFSIDELKVKEEIRNALLAPSIIYTPYLKELLKKKSLIAIAHITGGGFSNISRVLPWGAKIDYSLSQIERPFIFNMIQERSELSNEEMENTFNCGIGMVVIVKKKSVPFYLRYFKNKDLKSWVIGKIV